MLFPNLKFLSLILGLSFLIVGGVYLLKQYQLKQSASTPPTQLDQQQADTSALPNLAGGPAKIPSLPASPSAQQVRQYVTAVQEQAQEGNVLKISQCIAEPNDFKIKTGDSFTIQNSDEKEVKLSIALNAVYTVGANKNLTVKMAAEPAIYKYSCEQTGGISNAQAGVIYVTK